MLLTLSPVSAPDLTPAPASRLPTSAAPTHAHTHNPRFDGVVHGFELNPTSAALAREHAAAFGLQDRYQVCPGWAGG